MHESVGCITSSKIHFKFKFKFLIPERYVAYFASHLLLIHCLAYSSWIVNHKQFPLRLAYATTFNGYQGLMVCLTCTQICSHVDSYTQHFQEYDLSETQFERYLQEKNSEYSVQTSVIVIHRCKRTKVNGSRTWGLRACLDDIFVLGSIVSMSQGP